MLWYAPFTVTATDTFSAILRDISSPLRASMASYRISRYSSHYRGGYPEGGKLRPADLKNASSHRMTPSRDLACYRHVSVLLASVAGLGRESTIAAMLETKKLNLESSRAAAASLAEAVLDTYMIDVPSLEGSIRLLESPGTRNFKAWLLKLEFLESVLR